MKIVIDTSVLIFMADPHAPAPLDPDTGKPVPHCRERVEGLLEGLDDAEAVLIVPTPVLSELLICADSRQQELLAAISGKRSVLIASFDPAAALENAQLRRSKKLQRKVRGETKKEVSFDLQVLAIARANQADLLLTDDGGLTRRCRQAGTKVMGVGELPLPDGKRQISLVLEQKSAQQPADQEDSDESGGLA